jgi:hypothetical protein
MNTLKAVVWMGSSKDDLIAFPADARREAGYQLESVQRGVEPQDWKPMSSVGPGVREIRIREPSGAFRVMYLATRPEDEPADEPSRPGFGKGSIEGCVDRNVRSFDESEEACYAE